MKKRIFIFAWILTYLIPFSYFLFYDLIDCSQSDLDVAFISEQTLGIIIMVITFPIIFRYYKSYSTYYFLVIPHLVILYFLVKLLTKYLVQTTIKGIQPCIVLENNVLFGKIELTNYQYFQELFTQYYRLYAVVGIFSVSVLIIIGFKMFKIKYLNKNLSKYSIE